jgi:hypothetical protein
MSIRLFGLDFTSDELSIYDFLPVCGTATPNPGMRSRHRAPEEATQYGWAKI